MPPAPAPGGKVIMVAVPGGRVRKGGFDFNFLLGGLAVAAAITIVSRLLRSHRARRHST
jgi:hypothetical protein